MHGHAYAVASTPSLIIVLLNFKIIRDERIKIPAFPDWLLTHVPGAISRRQLDTG